MSTKTIAFRQPSAVSAPSAKELDEFVSPTATSLTILPDNKPPPVRMSRMTIPIPHTLHTRFKFQCLRRGKKECEVGAAMIERIILELEKE